MVKQKKKRKQDVFWWHCILCLLIFFFVLHALRFNLDLYFFVHFHIKMEEKKIITYKFMPLECRVLMKMRGFSLYFRVLFFYFTYMYIYSTPA